MPCVCHICQLIHVHIGDNYVSIYTSHEPNAISNMTRSTGVNTFHMTDLCPGANIHATLHMHVPFLHIDPTFLHISLKNQQNATLIQHIIAKDVPVIYLPLQFHKYCICPHYLTRIYGESMPIYIPNMKFVPLMM